MIRGSDGIGTHIVEIFVEHGRTSGIGTEIVVYDSGFVPGFGFDSVHEVSGESVDEVGGESVDEESAKNSSSEEDDDSYDSDRSDESDPEYMAAFQTPLEDVEVDMRLYKAIVDFDVVEAAVAHISDVGGLNPCMDTYESSDDERLSVLNSKLRKFKGKERNNDDECPFYVGRLIPLKETLNEMVKIYAIHARRDLYIKKNDPLRFRVICLGTNPNLVAGEGSNVSSKEKLKVKKGK
ncbi:uncharacterized protein LOC143572087 isoform X2 [Bidens hawaiensis]|uniref:uncharacterized protein LOC143572087 isoform X2 n=1 Tax=Bidens hawaiensis TaxID=980011 RepID=UPI0040490448